MLRAAVARVRSLVPVARSVYIRTGHVARAIGVRKRIWSSKQMSTAATDAHSEVQRAARRVKAAAEVTAPEPIHSRAKGIWKSIVTGVREVWWEGMKAIVTDTGTVIRLGYRTVRGRELSWRESNELWRASADLFRLAPFVVLISVPFMEFVLPFVILFQRWKASRLTFEDHMKFREELMTRKHKLQVDMLSHLEGVMKEMGKAKPMSPAFSRIVQKVRDGYAIPSNLIYKHARDAFDATDWSLCSRALLVDVCRSLGIPAIGPTRVLRHLIRYRLRTIHAEDALLANESLESLTTQELVTALERRLLTEYVDWQDPEFMRTHLKTWLHTSVTEQVPVSLMLFARTQAQDAVYRTTAESTHHQSV